DVFVVLNCFESIGSGCGDVVTHRRNDTRIAAQFKVTLPEIYGYKDTASKPIKTEACKGAHYPDWRKKWAKSLLTDETREILQSIGWQKFFRERYYYDDSAVKARR